MKNVINVVCICFGVLVHQDKYVIEIPDVAFNMPVILNNSSVVAVQEKRRLHVRRENINAINYPNPFSSSTTILYNISIAGNVTITLYDLLGREVCGYDEGFKSIGMSMKKINLSFLNSGVYFYEIRVDGRREAFSRLTLLK